MPYKRKIAKAYALQNRHSRNRLLHDGIAARQHQKDFDHFVGVVTALQIRHDTRQRNRLTMQKGKNQANENDTESNPPRAEEEKDRKNKSKITNKNKKNKKGT